MILDEIVEKKKMEFEERRKSYIELARGLGKLPPARNFLNAISTPDKVNLIAEVKKFSPSNPEPVEGFDAAEIAGVYESNGASAISVLTDEHYFGGSLEHLSSVKAKVKVPVLCKDFIIDYLQISAARACGADAVLLIARILEKEKISHLLGVARFIGVSCLVEVHDESDLRKVLATNARIIGINNRDLDTFKINLDTTTRIKKLIPEDKIIVSESGIKTHRDVDKLRNSGVNAILVGEVLMRSSDIAGKIKELGVG